MSVTISTPHSTPYTLSGSEEPGARVFVLCPDKHLLEGATDATKTLHATMLDELISIISSLPVGSIVQEGYRPTYLDARKDLMKNGVTARECLEKANPNTDQGRKEYLRWAVLSDDDLETRRDRLVKELGGKHNTGDILDAIYCRDLRCIQAEDEGLSKDRTDTVIQLDRIKSLFNRDANVRDIAAAAGLGKLYLFPGIPWSRFVCELRTRPSSKDEKKRQHARAANYGKVRYAITSLERRNVELSFERAHAEAIRRVDGLVGNTLVIYGAYHMEAGQCKVLPAALGFWRKNGALSGRETTVYPVG